MSKFISPKTTIQTLLLPISNKREIAKNTFEITFNVVNKKLDYQAGQYLEIRLPKQPNSDPKGNFRLFSFASSPSIKTHIAIAFRNSGSGFKESLLKLNIGEKVEISGPFGFFTLPKNTSLPLVFIACGMGITPFLSMVNYATETGLKYKITLIYVNRSELTAAYLDELLALKKKNPNFDLHLKYGRLDHNFFSNSTINLSRSVFYIAGPPFMVPEFSQILTELNVEQNKIITEEFIGY